jgi:Family of unknown function (DUF5694)
MPIPRPVRIAILLLSTLPPAAPLLAQDPEPELLRGGWPRAKVMLLGTFHFQDSGQDGYKPQVDVDVRSPERQREVEEIVDRIARFRPTKVAVEQRHDRQARLDSLYREHVAGRWELGANEIYQLGFRLARAMGHERVYAVDAPARWYDPGQSEEDFAARARAMGQEHHLATRWDTLYYHLYAHGDSLKASRTLRETLLEANDPARVRLGHGHYLVGSFRVGKDEDYLGADTRTAWYNRNLRIFHNLTRITGSPGERIVFIVGSGHLPILRHLVESSPEYELVEPSEYLGNP